MKNLFHTLALMVTLATVGGCELYFGDHNSNSGDWNYCGADGFYACSGDSCHWVSGTCPTNTGSNECTTSQDCAAGCYCQNGTCEEAGFCTDDTDCGTGYHCNTDRSSCEPNPPGCQADTDCAAGTFCDVPSGTCTIGSCAGTVTCTTAKPTCPSGQVPLIFNGCYTGACFDTATCAPAPACENINDEANCVADSCVPSYTGHNCTKSDGSACSSQDTGCTCEYFTFATCGSN
jgi:hypothetical protein